ncbi:MAG: hypothetical protein KAT65_23450 [Methanophagales archaeon]|nr:hypothetical protein [Methanophagales archaeon]
MSMKDSQKQKESWYMKRIKRRFTPLGYLILIGGVLLAVVSAVLLRVDRYFYGLHGTLGLSGTFWAFVGLYIWVGVTWGIVIILAVKLGSVEVEQ